MGFQKHKFKLQPHWTHTYNIYNVTTPPQTQRVHFGNFVFGIKSDSFYLQNVFEKRKKKKEKNIGVWEGEWQNGECEGHNGQIPKIIKTKICAV